MGGDGDGSVGGDGGDATEVVVKVVDDVVNECKGGKRMSC